MPIDPASQLIDATWLADNAVAFGSGPDGPWLVGRAFTVAGRSYPVPVGTRPGTAPYALAADVRATGTAFVYGGPGVILDLDGHTVTYNDADPIVVPDGDFSDWPGTWDASGAGQSTFSPVDSAPVYMPNATSLRWEIAAAAGPQSIVSAPIALAEVRAYTASACSRSGSNTYFGVQVEVLDAGTLAHVAKWRRFIGNLNNAEGGIISFVPDRAGQPVRLRITPTTVPARPLTTLIIGRAAVSRSMDYGVLATRVDVTALGGCIFTSALADPTYKVNAGSNIPRPILMVYQKGGASPTLRCSRGTGRVVQGRARGAYCHAVILAGAAGAVTVEGVQVEAAGDDTAGIFAHGASNAAFAVGDSTTVRNCRVTYPESGCHVTTRQQEPAAIDAAAGGPATVEGNTLLNYPHVGIKVGTLAEGAPALVRGNTLDPNMVITNGYSILIIGNNVRVTGNSIVSSRSGQGIMIDWGGHDIEVDDNVIDLYNGPNREYDLGLICRCLNFRGLNMEPIRRLRVRGNRATARTRAGKAYEAVALKYFSYNKDNIGDPDQVFSGNVLRALVEGDVDPGPRYTAVGMLMDVCPPGVNPRFEGNRFEGTDVGVQLAGRNSTGEGAMAGITLAGNTIARPAEGLTSRAHASWQFGFMNMSVAATLLGNAHEGGATPAIRWFHYGAMDIRVGWTLTVRARDTAGAPAPGATATLTDAAGDPAGSGVTDAAGELRLPAIVTRYVRGPLTSKAPAATSLSPHTLTVTPAAGGGPPAVRSLTPTADMTVDVDLAPAPPPDVTPPDVTPDAPPETPPDTPQAGPPAVRTLVLAAGTGSATVLAHEGG